MEEDSKVGGIDCRGGQLEAKITRGGGSIGWSHRDQGDQARTLSDWHQMTDGGREGGEKARAQVSAALSEIIQDRLELLGCDLALHESEVTGEAAEEFVITRFFDGENDGIFFTRSKELGVSEDGLFVGFLGGNEISRFSDHGFHGPRREVCPFIENDEVVPHCYFGNLTDVFEGQFDDFASGDFNLLLVKLHLVVAGDRDFEIGFFVLFLLGCCSGGWCGQK